MLNVRHCKRTPLALQTISHSKGISEGLKVAECQINQATEIRQLLFPEPLVSPQALSVLPTQRAAYF